jgi:hypothetical protein
MPQPVCLYALLLSSSVLMFASCPEEVAYYAETTPMSQALFMKKIVFFALTYFRIEKLRTSPHLLRKPTDIANGF